MSRKQISYLMSLMIVLFSSCLKEEKPVKPPELSGDVETAQIPMGQDYTKQFFFDLGTNSIVRSNLKTDWDLAFECGFEGYHIILNTSKFMFAYNTGSEDFSKVYDPNVSWNWDVNSGNLDSTAIGDWGEYADGMVRSYKQVYLIDRGVSVSGSALGMKKVVFDKLEDDVYKVRYANLDGSDEHVVEVKKEDNYNFVYLSLDNEGKQVTIAPEKTTWDLAFTQYTHIFSESPASIPEVQGDTLIPYLVTGVIQNRNDVLVGELLNKKFEDITLDDALNMTFDQSKIDVIGYDWKFFNFDEVTYTVLPDKNYIVKDTEGYFYKLHFVDFYSTSGEKGFPKFEFQRL